MPSSVLFRFKLVNQRSGTIGEERGVLDITVNCSAKGEEFGVSETIV